jgi:hypothetical protein
VAAIAGWAIVLAVVTLALLAEPALAQCRMCRSALESAEAAPLAWAFRRAILFLLATPFVTVAVIAISIARDARRRPPTSGDGAD